MHKEYIATVGEFLLLLKLPLVLRLVIGGVNKGWEFPLLYLSLLDATRSTSEYYTLRCHRCHWYALLRVIIRALLVLGRLRALLCVPSR